MLIPVVTPAQLRAGARVKTYCSQDFVALTLLFAAETPQVLHPNPDLSPIPPGSTLLCFTENESVESDYYTLVNLLLQFC